MQIQCSKESLERHNVTKAVPYRSLHQWYSTIQIDAPVILYHTNRRINDTVLCRSMHWRSAIQIDASMTQYHTDRCINDTVPYRSMHQWHSIIQIDASVIQYHTDRCISDAVPYRSMHQWYSTIDASVKQYHADWCKSNAVPYRSMHQWYRKVLMLHQVHQQSNAAKLLKMDWCSRNSDVHWLHKKQKPHIACTQCLPSTARVGNTHDGKPHWLYHVATLEQADKNSL